MKHIELIQNLTDEQLKNLVREFLQLHEEGKFPENSEFHKLSKEISTILDMQLNIHLTESLIQMEVFKRYVKTEPVEEFNVVTNNSPHIEAFMKEMGEKLNRIVYANQEAHSKQFSKD
jgi:hypothetical protein